MRDDRLGNDTRGAGACRTVVARESTDRCFAQERYTEAKVGKRHSRERFDQDIDSGIKVELVRVELEAVVSKSLPIQPAASARANNKASCARGSRVHNAHN